MNRLVAARLADTDRLLFARFGDRHRLLAFGRRDPHFTHLFVVGHVAARLLNGFRGGLLTDRVDVTRLVRDIGDIHVDQLQTQLGQLGLQRALNVFQERVAVAIDLIDPHRSDHLSQLTEDHFFRLLADFTNRQAEQADGRLLHQGRFRADGHREHTRYVHANILNRQRASQRNLDLHRFQAQIGVILQEWNHELRASVDRFGGLARLFTAPPNHQDPVAGAAFVLLGQNQQKAQKQHDNKDDDDN